MESKKQTPEEAPPSAGVATNRINKEREKAPTRRKEREKVEARERRKEGRQMAWLQRERSPL